MFRKALTVATFAATAAAALTPTSASAQWQGYDGGYQRYNDYAGGSRYGDDGRPRWMYTGGERNGYYGGGSYPERRYAPRYRSRARYYRGPGHYYRYRRHRCSGTTGLIIGAMAGGLLGHSLGHHHHATGTILGAGLGALAGREIGRSTC
jgi:hypothetical protein